MPVSRPIRTARRVLCVAGALALAASPPVASAAPSPTPTPAPTQSPGPVVDRYGQVTSAAWQGKVRSDAQLRADVRADAAYYGSLRPPRRDAYGGQPDSRSRLGLTRTGFFHVEKTRDGRSTLVDPSGNQFFSTGLAGLGSLGDTYTQTAGRENVYEQLPPTTGSPLSAGWMNGRRENYSFYLANQVRKYGTWDPKAYWQRQVARAQRWGFNTVGGFSDLRERAAAPAPYVAHLDDVPEHAIGDSGLYDVYRPGVDAEIRSAMVKNVAQYKGDRNLIGYMFFNEIPWTRLRTAVPQAKASEAATKGAFVDFLRTRYDSIAAFDAAWEQKATSFEALKEESFSPRTDAAVADTDAFTARYLDRFYGLFADAIRAADPDHLVMGDRWFGNVMNNATLRRSLATAAGRHLDVLTYNYYTWDVDLARIKEIYDASGGTPMILTEFHYGEPSHGLTFGIRMGRDEDDKGRLYRNYVEKAAASGMVVGTHWFEYLDQAATGRWYQGADGEAGGIGLLDVADRPYKRMLAHVMRSNYGIYALAEGRAVPYHYAFGPGQTERNATKTTQIPRASSPLKVDGTLDAAWPTGPTLSLGAADLIDGVALDGVGADVRLAWDQTYLYLHGTVADPTPMKNQFHGFDIWNGDAVELFVGPKNVDAGGAIRVQDSQIIISAQPQNASGALESHWYNERSDQPKIEAVAKAAPGGYTIEAAIKLTDLGVDGVVTTPRDLRFDLGFDDGNGRQRQRQFMWNGVDGNADNRDAWGRAQLVDTASTAPGGTPTTPLPAAASVLTGRTPVDGQIVVGGTGAAGAVYDVRLDGWRFGRITVPAAGTFETPLDLPTWATPGRHRVTVTQTTGATGERVLAAQDVQLTRRDRSREALALTRR